MSEDEEDKVMAQFSKRMLDEINNTPISTEDMIEAVQEVGELKPEHRNFIGHAMTIHQLHKGNRIKSKSIKSVA